MCKNLYHYFIWIIIIISEWLYLIIQMNVITPRIKINSFQPRRKYERNKWTRGTESQRAVSNDWHLHFFLFFSSFFTLHHARDGWYWTLVPRASSAFTNALGIKCSFVLFPSFFSFSFLFLSIGLVLLVLVTDFWKRIDKALLVITTMIF